MERKGACILVVVSGILTVAVNLYNLFDAVAIAMELGQASAIAKVALISFVNVLFFIAIVNLAYYLAEEKR